MVKAIRALTSEKRPNNLALCEAASHVVNQNQGQSQDQVTMAALKLARLLGRQLALEEFGTPASRIIKPK
ncbi:MAG: hypothetical protein B7X48_09830 [Acidiphilium sp. 34-60-192]|nr:MAG: hypothetical protein B7X48_09830 [Acidiphilium sp. 34-60-192]